MPDKMRFEGFPNIFEKNIILFFYSFFQGVESDHLKYNYGTLKKEEIKTRRITVATMRKSLN